MSRLPVVYHPGYSIPMPETHPFPMAKFHRLRAHFDASGLSDVLAFHRPEPAPWSAIERVHTAVYTCAFREGGVDERAQRRTGFPWSPELVERTRLEVGGTLLTVRLALARGLACNAAGGTHHAFPDYGSGYCLLNDIAVAAADALAEYAVRRVLVVDLDVHQGDGTAFIFADDPRVYTLSMHAADNFPARKQASDRDVPLPRGTDDAAYLGRLAAELPPLLDALAPELVIYDAGVDVHADDRLGHLSLSDDGLYRRDAYVIGACRARGLPTACVIGGGYDRDLEALAARHAVLHRAAAAAWSTAAMLE